MFLSTEIQVNSLNMSMNTELKEVRRNTAELAKADHEKTE